MRVCEEKCSIEGFLKPGTLRGRARTASRWKPISLPLRLLPRLPGSAYVWPKDHMGAPSEHRTPASCNLVPNCYSYLRQIEFPSEPSLVQPSDKNKKALRSPEKYFQHHSLLFLSFAFKFALAHLIDHGPWSLNTDHLIPTWLHWIRQNPILRTYSNFNVYFSHFRRRRMGWWHGAWSSGKFRRRFRPRYD